MSWLERERKDGCLGLGENRWKKVKSMTLLQQLITVVMPLIPSVNRFRIPSPVSIMNVPIVINYPTLRVTVTTSPSRIITLSLPGTVAPSSTYTVLAWSKRTIISQTPYATGLEFSNRPKNGRKTPSIKGRLGNLLFRPHCSHASTSCRTRPLSQRCR